MPRARRTGSDVLTKEQRSLCMSRNRGKNTGPELELRKALWKLGLRYRLGYQLPGRPDIVFVSARVAVFVDGCFWHACPVHFSRPRSNREFWRRKILANQRRDRVVSSALAIAAWRVVRVWEHEIRESASSAARKISAVVRRGADMQCR